MLELLHQLQISPVYAMTDKERRKRQEQQFKDNYYRTDSDEFNAKYYVKGAKVPATSSGNYEHYMYNKEHSFLGFGSRGSLQLYIQLILTCIRKSNWYEMCMTKVSTHVLMIRRNLET